MAVPFRRTSKTKRCAHSFKENSSNVVLCKMRGTVAPHRACTACGYYKGKVIEHDSEEK